MELRFKVLTAGAVGLLLGFGLCGVDSLILSSKHEEFGGVLSLTGFAICLAAACLLAIGLLWVVIVAFVSLLENGK